MTMYANISLYEQPIEILLEIFSYIYPIRLCNSKLNIHSLIKTEYNKNNDKYENKLLHKQLNDIMNISYSCKYFYNIIKKNFNLFKF